MVIAASSVYWSAGEWVAAASALILEFSRNLGALVFTVPNGVIGGATMVLYGLIGILGVRIWMEAKVDFTDPVNLTVAAAALGGIAWGSIGILVAYPIMRYLAKFRTSSNR